MAWFSPLRSATVASSDGSTASCNVDPTLSQSPRPPVMVLSALRPVGFRLCIENLRREGGMVLTVVAGEPAIALA